jgi:hypothetical protein
VVWRLWLTIGSRDNRTENHRQGHNRDRNRETIVHPPHKALQHPKTNLPKSFIPDSARHSGRNRGLVIPGIYSGIEAMAPASVLSEKEHPFGVGDGGSSDAVGKEFHFLPIRGSVVGHS